MARYTPRLDLWAEPLSQLRRIQEEMNRTFGDYRWGGAPEFPPINVWRGEEAIVVTAEIPGVSTDHIEITVHQNTLTIKGRQEPEVAEPEVSFHRQERSYGSFARTISLPFNVDPDKVRANAENGILTAHMLRPETDKPRKIQISKA